MFTKAIYALLVHFCRENDLRALSGKFLRVIFCRPESFDFLLTMEQFLWHDCGGVDSEKTELPIGLTHCSADTNTGDIFYYLREIQDFWWDQS